MIPTIAQITAIIILLVPGFISIQIYSNLTHTKKNSNFDSTVLSIVFTIIIHGLYTTIFSYFNISHINNLFSDIENVKWSSNSAEFSLIYLVGLFLSSILIGLVASFFRHKGRYYKIAKKLGFKVPFENLWDEVMLLYSIQGTAPLILVNFENISYAGTVHSSSYDLNKHDRREIILKNSKFFNKNNNKWEKCVTDVVYLDLSEVKEIYLSNGNKIL